jgi:hypothetical protein
VNIADPSDGSVNLVEATKEIAGGLGFEFGDQKALAMRGMNRRERRHSEPVLVFAKG